MWWMGVFYGGYLVVLLVEVWSMFTTTRRIHQWACTVAACIAILAPATLGAVFGVLAAKPFWFGLFTPILMVASAFLAGTALLGIVFYAGPPAPAGRTSSGPRPSRCPSVRLLLGDRPRDRGRARDRARSRPASAGTDARGSARRPIALVTGPLALLFWGAGHRSAW